MSVILEDYFQVAAFRRVIEREQWGRFESRLIRNTETTLQLLNDLQIRATFFVLGWNAERWPQLLQEIVAQGHEVASGGFGYENLRHVGREEFVTQLDRARDVIEQAIGRPVLGYRLSDGWLRPEDLWVLDVLAERGYAYDSSILPRGRQYHHEPWRRWAHVHTSGTSRLWEFPPSSMHLAGLDLPISGGNYFRQIPHTLMNRLVDRHARSRSAPLMFYFHVWELDREQPRVSAAGPLSRMRHYRNLGKMHWVLDDYCSRYRFTSVARYFETHEPDFWQERSRARALPPRDGPRPAPVRVSTAAATNVPQTSLSIVIPCYNEEASLPFLANTLESLRGHLQPEYGAQFIFVDDCSTDATWNVLQHHFGPRSDCTLLRHAANQGVAAAILTGLRAAGTDIVCSIDCDCSYDPHTLRQMLPLLTPEVDLVTASPYHPDGAVKNVPGWRLLLSRGASSLYRLALGQNLSTFTSCFRVYRRSAVEGITLDHGNFLGVAELLGRVSLAGGQIVEYPTTLKVRLFGQSKMKTARTIVGHLGLMSSLFWKRLRTRTPRTSRRPPRPASEIRAGESKPATRHSDSAGSGLTFAGSAPAHRPKFDTDSLPAPA